MGRNFNFKKRGGRAYKSWKKWTIGDFIVGKFIKTYEDNFGNTCYEVEIIEAQFADGTELKEGSLFGVNSCGSLSHNMQDVLPGSFVEMTYDGEGEIEKGSFKGKKFHSVQLSVDDDSVDVEAIKNAESSEEEKLGGDEVEL